jgi:hypothetical protein
VPLPLYETYSSAPYSAQAGEEMADNVADRVKKVVAEEADQVKSLTTDAVRSGAYLYPFKVAIMPRQNELQVIDW